MAGGTPVGSERSEEVERYFKEAGLGVEPNVRWAPSGRAVYFKGVSRGVRNLWKVTVDPRTLRWVAGRNA